MKKQEETIDKDPLQEAVLSAKLMEEMYKGPLDKVVSQDENTDAATDEEVATADDSGE